MILLIENNADDVGRIMLGMERAGVVDTVLMVGSAEEAIAYFRGRGRFWDRREFPFPRLVFLDLSLPDASGLQVLRWLRREKAYMSVPVVVLTGSVSRGEVEIAYRAGANSFILKGFDLVADVWMAARYWLNTCKLPRVGSGRGDVIATAHGMAAARREAVTGMA